MIRPLRTDKKGFVLLMVLVTVVVVGVALTTTAKRSLLATIASLESQQSLQRRWGIFSCQKSLLPAASGVFEASDLSIRRQRGKQLAFPSVLQDRVVLGRQMFDLLLSDEDAKANLNAIYDAGGIRRCEQAVTQLTGPFEARTVSLQPSRQSVNAVTASSSRESGSKLNEANNEDSGQEIVVNDIIPAFRSWGEVFDMVKVYALSGEDRQLAKMTRKLSIVSTGRLNVFRADDEAILAVCGAVTQAGLAKKILSKIRDTSLGDVNLILEQTVTNTKDRQALLKLLGGSSSSFSLWIEASDKSSRQQYLAIQSPNEIGTVQTTEFSFE